jgi:uncharacterized protein with HEPN domain
MRDRLVHHYFAIDLDILWFKIANDLPGADQRGRL